MCPVYFPGQAGYVHRRGCCPPQDSGPGCRTRRGGRRAVSAAGVPESHINLQIVQKMEQLFTFVGESYYPHAHRSGQPSIPAMPKALREKKISDLNNRVEMINQTPRGFLISIHQNSLPGTKARGAQVFYNAVAPAKDAAVSVQQALNSGINGNNRKNAKQIDESIFLMNNIQRPGILVECGISVPRRRSGDSPDGQSPASSVYAIVSGYLQSRTENE
ncbi:MAG: N-acetylmuramoyl-L-alanine amidase [Oscillospiraceae bacterium]